MLRLLVDEHTFRQERTQTSSLKHHDCPTGKTKLHHKCLCRKASSQQYEELKRARGAQNTREGCGCCLDIYRGPKVLEWSFSSKFQQEVFRITKGFRSEGSVKEICPERCVDTRTTLSSPSVRAYSWQRHRYMPS